MSEHFTFKTSTNVKAANYDSETRTLNIAFHHGKEYPSIKDVSPETWRAFKNAESPGRFVNAKFRSR